MTGAALVVGAIIFVGALLKLGSEDAPPVVRKKLAKRAVQSIAELADDKLGTIRGTVAVLEARLEAPLSRRACVYWRVVIEEVGTGGDSVELGRREEAVPFLVRTEAGTARVVLEKPSCGLTPQVFSSYTVPFEVEGFAKPPRHPGSTVRVQEFRVEPDRAITVSGWVALETDPDAAKDTTGYRADLPMRPVISGSRRAPLLIGD